MVDTLLPSDSISKAACRVEGEYQLWLRTDDAELHFEASSGRLLFRLPRLHQKVTTRHQDSLALIHTNTSAQPITCFQYRDCRKDSEHSVNSAGAQ